MRIPTTGRHRKQNNKPKQQKPMKYDAKILKLAGAYYTDARGVIYSILRASGVNAAAAYTHAYLNTDIREDQRERRAKDLEAGQYISELIAHLKAAKKTPIILHDDNSQEDSQTQTQRKKNKNKGDDGGKVLQTFSEVRDALAQVAGDVEGKDKAGVLVQLAKMLPEERREEEKRVLMYLPFNSDCKQCTLYLQEQQKKDK